MLRRNFLGGAFTAMALVGQGQARRRDSGTKLAEAAKKQLGVTTSYDPNYTKIAYPGGDVPRSTGVCADVVVRAARDGLSLDLQQLVHEDMAHNFAGYPKAWGARGPDANIDHRRVLNLEAYWRRGGCCRWTARAKAPGDAFPQPIEVGDLFTWLLDGRLPHIGVVVAASAAGTSVVHNIGAGVQQNWLVDFAVHEAKGHYRWPVT
jgi:uncharacterized protein YijF (DUF1287 family)